MNPLLTLPGAVAGDAHGPDAQVAAHYGDPLAEQRALARSAAVVDRSHRELIAVSGEDRLSWLHLLLTQHVSELAEGAGTEALVLDANGRVERHAVLAHVRNGGPDAALAGSSSVWLDVEPGTSAALLGYLTKMVFWSKVQPRDRTDEWAVLSVVGPDTAAVLAAAEVPPPERSYQVTALAGGGFVRRMPSLSSPVTPEGPDAADLVVPRAELLDWWTRLRRAGAVAAGTMAYEAMRVAALRPRLGMDTDEKTIPHEVGWIPTAVHLAKGCYRGQETVARVANLGRPPRRLVLLHTDGGDEEPLRPGDAVTRDGRVVGRVGTAVLHHELGGVALALVKRSVPVEDAGLLAGGAGERVTPVRIDPDSVTGGDGSGPPGRLARARTGRIPDRSGG